MRRWKAEWSPCPSIRALRTDFAQHRSWTIIRNISKTVNRCVLPHAGTRLVPENFCFIPEQIVLKEEQIVYRFYRLDSGTIALFRKRFNTIFEAIYSFLVELGRFYEQILKI